MSEPAPWGWRGVGAAFFLLALIAFAAGCWTAAYYVMEWVFARSGVDPSPLARQLATGGAGVILMLVPSIIVGMIHRPREFSNWTAAMNAIKRIGNGDFGVRIDIGTPRVRHPFAQLVHGINDMAADLDKLERMRQTFITDVSHELQSPLTSIGGFAKALRDEELPQEERRRYAEIIAMEADRLSRLSDNLLRLTALEADGGPGLRPEPIRLDRQLQRIILSAEPQWMSKGLDLSARLEPIAILGDEALLDRVWGNLLHNAIKFTPAGGRIVVAAGRTNGGILVEVADTGIGIAPEEQPRIFERFFKADPSRNREAGGSGLGLPLVEKIVKLHGGRIAVASEPGLGSTFSVTLSQEDGAAGGPGPSSG